MKFRTYNWVAPFMGGLLFLGALEGLKVWSQDASTPATQKKLPSKTTKEAPIRADEPVQIALPAKLRGKGRKLRIRNLTTGKEAIIDLSDEEFISSDKVRDLVDANSKLLVPEFSILDAPPPPVKIDPKDNLTSSLALDQPIWRPLGFHTTKLPSGITQIQVDPKAQSLVMSSVQAERRRNLQEDQGIKRLFDVGWKALKVKRFDISEEAFTRILNKTTNLTKDSFSQASLGRGISRFHQKGCDPMEADFRFADEDPKNYDDISYYRALCFVEKKRFSDAEVLFRELATKQHPVYGERSRFYLGVVAENSHQWDEAESAYRDTIDFSSDAPLVELAKSRLENLKKLKADYYYQNKWFSLAASLGGGYDSNVVGVPSSVAPASYNLTNEASASVLGLLFGEADIPWAKTVHQKVRSTVLDLHYFNSSVSQNYDARTYDLGTLADVAVSSRTAIGAGVNYESLFLGLMGVAGEYMATSSFEAHFQEVFGDLRKPTSTLQSSLKVSLLRPRTAASTPALDLTATDYLWSTRYLLTDKTPKILGSGIDLEFHPATTGTENSFYAATLVGRWDLPVFPASWHITLNQEGTAQSAVYYQSAESRKDEILRYTGSLAHPTTEWSEIRLQFIGTISMSTFSSKYEYDKVQASLLYSAFF